MRKIKNAPRDRAFFNEHGGSLSAYGLIGFLGQTLSGLSLAYAVFVLLVAQVFAGESVNGWTFASLVVMAIAVGCFVELSNRVLARRAIRPFVVKDLFREDEETARRHRILNRSYLVGLVSVALLSYFFSIVGSAYYADDTTKSPALVSLDSIRNTYANQERAVLRSFAADSATVTSPYEEQLVAVRAGFLADSSALMRQRTDFYGCAQRGNGYCKKMRRQFLTDIDGKRSELAKVVAAISQQRLAAMAEVLTARDDQLSAIRASLAADLDAAKTTNGMARDEQENDAGFKGMVFIILTVAGQTIFYFMVYLRLQVEAGSKIDHQLQPNEFWTLPSIVQELKVTAAWRLERGARRLIRWLFPQPDAGQKTAIPYGALFAETADDGE
jgi:hypothetical protein